MLTFSIFLATCLALFVIGALTGRSGSSARRGRRPRQGFAVAERAFVIDGDTLGFDGRRVRLFGIDAPERDHRQGPAATRALRELMAVHDTTTLLIEPVSQDGYGRLVARVFTADGVDLGAEMVATGFARAARAFSRDYVRAETAARRHGLGLWGQEGGIDDPAAWRAATRQTA